MAKDHLAGTLAVILHADIAGSTALVQQDKQLAHERIQDTFQRFSDTIEKYQGHVLELRGCTFGELQTRRRCGISCTLLPG